MVIALRRLCVFVLLVCIPMHVFAVVAAAGDNNGNGRIIVVDRPDHTRSIGAISIRYQLSARSIYTQQMLKVEYQIETDDAFISLRTDIEARNGEEYVTLSARKSELPQTAGRRYRYDLAVLYNTSHSGNLEFRVPDLIYSEGGQDAYRFRFAHQPIQVIALPPYLPPYIPVGTIDIQSSLSATSSWLRPLMTGKVYYWNITVTGTDVSARSLPDIDQQISSDRHIQFLPSELSVSSESDNAALVQTMHYSIPFTLTRSAVMQLPQIRLQYFDVDKRRIVARSHSQDSLVVVAPFIYWSIVSIVVVLPLLWLWNKRTLATRLYRNLHSLKQARDLLRQAHSAQQIRVAMNTIGQSMGWPANLSLSQWRHYWHQNIAMDQSIDSYIHSLSMDLYAKTNAEYDMAGLRSLLMRASLRQYKACIRACL